MFLLAALGLLLGEHDGVLEEDLRVVEAVAGLGVPELCLQFLEEVGNGGRCQNVFVPGGHRELPAVSWHCTEPWEPGR